MSNKWADIDVSQLKRLQSNLNQLEKIDFNKFCEQMTNEIAQRLIRRVKQRTPV